MWLKYLASLGRLRMCRVSPHKILNAHAIRESRPHWPRIMGGKSYLAICQGVTEFKNVGHSLTQEQSVGTFYPRRTKFRKRSSIRASYLVGMEAIEFFHEFIAVSSFCFPGVNHCNEKVLDCNTIVKRAALYYHQRWGLVCRQYRSCCTFLGVRL